MSEKNRCHLIISTHTTRHLESVLKGVSLLNPKPESISVTCDVENDEIKQLIEDCSQQFDLRIFYTAREHQGIMRLAQTRNNAVRTLLKNKEESGRLIFIDGDMVLPVIAIRLHHELSKLYDAVACDRFNLTEQQTHQFLEQLQNDKLDSPKDSSQEIKRLRSVDTSRKKHALLRKLGLTKPNKPKIIGCHLSIDFEEFSRLNGFDERFEGYGCEDDDLARRVHAAKLRYGTAASEITAFHLFHLTQAQKDWKENPGSKIYQSEPWQACCKLGLKNPQPQPEPTRYIFHPNQ